MDGQEIPEVLAGDEGKFSVCRPTIGFLPSLLEQVQDARGYLAHLPLFFYGVTVSLPINSFKPLQQKMPTQQEMDQKLKDVSSLYEKQFLRQMVKEMRQTVHQSGLSEQSMTEKIFQEKLDHEYVEEWGKNGGIGLSTIIYSQLKEKFAPAMQQLAPPKGPLPLQKGSTIKIDDTQNEGKTFHIQPAPGTGAQREVQAPWSGTVSKVTSGPDERNVVSLVHDQGVESTLHFTGRMNSISAGEKLQAGQALGVVSPDQNVLTWKIVQVES